jgi:hypothetical protein
MKEQENSPKTDETADLTKEQETKILFSLRSEAFSFVPDKLLAIFKACHIDPSIDGKSEKTLRTALQGFKFIPNELPLIEKATGTFDPLKDNDNLTLTIKVRNEGGKIVPDIESKVYQETGAKKHFSFSAFLKSHWLPLAEGTAAVALTLSAAAAVLANSGTNAVAASGTYITVSVTPASYLAADEAPEAEDTLPGDVNNYEPSWSFLADSNNVVSSYSCDNYSATLALRNFEPSFASKPAYEAVSDLVTPAHVNGYLETKNQTAKNVINITALSTDSSYGTSYGAAYQSALDDALTESSNKIYAGVNFSVATIASDYLKGLSKDEASTIVGLYSSFQNLDSKYALTLDELKKGDSGVLSALDSAVDAGEEAKLSDKGLIAFKEGLSESYRFYLNSEKTSYTAQQIEGMRQELIDDVPSIPWLCGNHLADLLQNDAYFIMGDDLGFSEDKDSPWYLYAQIRDYILKTRTASADSYVNYLSEIKDLAKSGKESTGYLPDNGQEGIDDGGHIPGDGPNANDWGKGGGEWHGPENG